jgi:ArsR family transcriptional regulator
MAHDEYMPCAPLPVVATAQAPCCSPLTGEPMSTDDADALAFRFKALADPMRLRLLSVIAAHEGAEACVCDLTELVGLSQPTVSHHLKCLVDAGLLTREKRGVWAYYALVPGAVDQLVAHLTSHLGSATA